MSLRLRLLRLSILLGIAVVVLVPSARGQIKMDVQFGGVTGLNFARFGGGVSDPVGALLLARLPDEVRAEVEPGRRTGFTGGVFALVDIEGPLAVRHELLYVQKGQQSKIRRANREGAATLTTRIDYLEIPVLAVVQLPVLGTVRPYVMAGPTLSFALRSSVELESGEEMVAATTRFGKSDQGAALGAGVDVRLLGGTATISTRYSFGFTDLTGLDTHHRGLMVTVGFGV